VCFRGTSDANIPFDGLLHLLGELGFEERIRESHHIFIRTGVEEILNLQPRGSHAKPYQVKQIRQVSCGTSWEATSMSKYEVIIYWSKDDQAFIAEVPELAGCAADGTTYQEALANVETVIREWIETAKELRRPIPEPKGRLAFA